MARAITPEQGVWMRRMRGKLPMRRGPFRVPDVSISVNYFAFHGLRALEMRDVERSHRVDRERQRAVACIRLPRPAAAPSERPKRTEDPCTIEALSFAMITECHVSVSPYLSVDPASFVASKDASPALQRPRVYPSATVPVDPGSRPLPEIRQCRAASGEERLELFDSTAG